MRKFPFRSVVFLLIVVAAVWGGIRWRAQHRASTGPPKGAGSGRGGGPVPVVAGTVTNKDIPIYLDGLGTVQAFNTVTVRSRVDGQITKIFFAEGQDVHTGDLVAEIDPAPYQAQLDQVTAKKGEDEAQLAVAKLNLRRDADLLASKILAQQDYDTQKALVEQLQATVQADQAAIDNAKVQLDYTRITAPLDGRVGIRLVDQGNVVHANDQNGIVVITQLQPISVVFTLPEQQLSDVQEHLGDSEGSSVLAVDRNNRTRLGEGKLAVVDNQIDTTTGTIRLKATFPNKELRLWPGQFVNARLQLTVRRGAILVPAQVIQRGPEGPFAFVIDSENKVAVRAVKVGQIQDGMAIVDDGLQPGERVVVDGQNKLQGGSMVKPSDRPGPPPSGRPGGAPGKPPGSGERRRQGSS